MFGLDAVWRALRGSLLEAIAPRECPGCCGALPEQAVFCEGCSELLERPPTRTIASVPLCAVGRYGGPLAHAIIALKYQHRSDFARPLGTLLARSVRLQPPPRRAVVVPVPLHPLRLAERGYNQASLLGRVVAAEFGIGFEPMALERLHWRRRQVGLDHDERQENVSGAFRVRNPKRLHHQPVLLVDDVFTTGATAAECVRTLRDSGALPHGILVVAIAESD